MKANWIDVRDDNGGREAWGYEVAKDRPDESCPFCFVSYGLRPNGAWRVLFELNCSEGRYSDDIATGAEARQIATALVEVFERMWP